VSTAADLGARSGGARADFSFRLTFAADGKAGGVWGEDVRIVCVYVFVRVKISEKRVGGVMRAEWCKGVGKGGQKGKTVVPRDLKEARATGRTTKQ
jgi:hypothetical protein